MKIDANSLTEIISNSSNIEKKGSMTVVTETVTTQKTDTQTGKVYEKKQATYERPVNENGSVTEEIEDAFGSLDAKQRKDQMAVLSNTTTAEDYSEMQKDGFSGDSTDSAAIVTEMDKIKMKLAEAGEDISYYGDTPDAAKIEETVGNAALAQHIASQMQENDVPVTEENVTDMKEAMDMASQLEPLSDGAVKYMLDNQLEPTIDNLYKAEYSGSAGYTSQTDDTIDFTTLNDQIDQVIANAGLQDSSQAKEDAQWMIQNQIPLTEENLTYLEDLKGLELPAKVQDVVMAMTEAIGEGNRPADAVLIEGYSMEAQAQKAMDVVSQTSEEDLTYLIDNEMDVTIQNLEYAQNQNQKADVVVDSETTNGELADSEISNSGLINSGETGSNLTDQELALVTARRQLEEIRLQMTTEANYALLKQEISIDTEPLEQLVEQLKGVEENYYKNLLGNSGIDPSEENIALFKQTTETVEQLKTMPADALGMNRFYESLVASVASTEDGGADSQSGDQGSNTDQSQATLKELYQNGTISKETYQKASQSYETMMTEVRKDLGDSINKAFQNVDTILEDIGMDTTEANQRAVRILGYNSLEINSTSVTQMKAADQQVQMAFKNMTPAVVQEFIKEGINPLDMDMGELNAKASQIKEEIGAGSEEKYSEYLWKLEQSNQITEEERSSYIGIYRLMDQVVKSDGAVVGALVNQGTDITMRNLLTAVRSSKQTNMDVSIDDSFGETESVTKTGTSITQQIETAYQTGCMEETVDLLSPEKWTTLVNTTEWEDMTPEQMAEQLRNMEESEEDTQLTKEYVQTQLDLMQEAQSVPTEVYQFLTDHNLANTVNNVLAASNMMSKRNVFNQLFEELPDSDEIDMEALKEQTLEDFSEAVKTPEDMAEAQKNLAQTAENVMKTFLETEDVSTIDIKQMKLINSQISIASKLAREEQYSIPVLVGDEMANVSLKIVRGKEEKGKVDIMFETPALGRVAAELSAAGEVLSGYIAAESQETADLLKNQDEYMQQTLSEEGNAELSYVVSEHIDLNQFGTTATKSAMAKNTTIKNAPEKQTKSAESTDEKTETIDQTEQQREVQTSTLYGIAERFLNAIQAISA